MMGPKKTRASMLAGCAAGLVAALFLVGATPASADGYEPEYAAHPLRVVAYILHPVGVILDLLIVRPAHFLVMHEPFKTLFGHTGPGD
jgi:hypothetical protein